MSDELEKEEIVWEFPVIEKEECKEWFVYDVNEIVEEESKENWVKEFENEISIFEDSACVGEAWNMIREKFNRQIKNANRD